LRKRVINCVSRGEEEPIAFPTQLIESAGNPVEVAPSAPDRSLVFYEVFDQVTTGLLSIFIERNGDVAAVGWVSFDGGIHACGMNAVVAQKEFVLVMGHAPNFCEAPVLGDPICDVVAEWSDDEKDSLVR